MINIIEGGVTAAKGFQASTAFVGMKGEGKKDLALIASTIPCVCAGVFTDNLVKGAPVLWDIERVSSGEVVQALLVNAGIANVCTGPEGLKKCERIAAAVADKMVVSQNSVLLGSTGRIGEDLPDDAIIEQIEGLCDGLDGSINAGTEAAIAMMTTDTREKQVAVNFTLSDGTLATLGGCAKGSSMVHPNMSTLLVYLTTDVKIDQPLLKKALEADVADTYNMLSIDGDTSTNDSVIVMSNGLAGNPPISDETDADYQLFKEVLHEVNLYLTKQIAQDAAGAKRLMSCQVIHAGSKNEAKAFAKAVITSNKIKTELGLGNLHWGGIIAAMGRTGFEFDPNEVDISIESRAGRLALAKSGVNTGYSAKDEAIVLGESEVTITVDINNGASEAVAYGCDAVLPL